MLELNSEQENSLKEYASENNIKYQQIIPTQQSKSHARDYLNAKIFSDMPKNFSYLDIGSNLGYFCLKALQAGAKQSVGVDPDPLMISQASDIAKIMKLEPEYIEAIFESTDFSNQNFDVISCLNVFHHLYDPINTLRKIMHLARHKIVIEFAVPTFKDFRKGRITLGAFLAKNSPAILLGNSKDLSDGSRTFMFTAESMRRLFNEHTALFEPVKISSSPFKGRLVLEAVRRRVSHLVLVAGPTSVGKSTFLKALESDATLRSKLGIADNSFIARDARNLGSLPAGKIDTLVLHYDFLRTYWTSRRSYSRDIALQICECAKDVSSVTLVAGQKILLERYAAEQSGKRNVPKRSKNILAEYGKISSVNAMYDEWFNHCQSIKNNSSSYYVRTDSSSGYEVTDGSKKMRWKS